MTQLDSHIGFDSFDAETFDEKYRMKGATKSLISDVLRRHGHDDFDELESENLKFLLYDVFVEGMEAGMERASYNVESFNATPDPYGCTTYTCRTEIGGTHEGSDAMRFRAFLNEIKNDVRISNIQYEEEGEAPFGTVTFKFDICGYGKPNITHLKGYLDGLRNGLILRGADYEDLHRPIQTLAEGDKPNENWFMEAESFNAESRMIGRSLSNDATITLNTVILVDLSGSTSQGIGMNDKGETIMIADMFYEEAKAIAEINERQLGDVTILGYGSSGGDGFLSGVHGTYTKKLNIHDRSGWTTMGGTRPISQELVQEIRNKLMTNNAPLQIINISDGLPNDYISTNRAESFNADSHMTATPVKQYRVSPRYRRSYTYLYHEDPHWENVDDLNERLVEIGFGRNDYFGKYHDMDMSYERMPFQQPVWTNHYEKGDVSWASLASVTPEDAELILSNIKPEHRDEVETYTLDDGNVILSFPWTAEVTETIHYGSE